MMTLKIEINGREIDRIDVINVGNISVDHDGKIHGSCDVDAYSVTHYDFTKQAAVQLMCVHNGNDGRLKLAELVCNLIYKKDTQNGKNSPIQKKRKSKAR